MLFYPLLLLGSVIFLDICLSGDNVLVIAMAANGIDAKLRDAAIFLGLSFAAVLRILLALGATMLLRQHWISFLSGVALLWVANRLLRDILARQEGREEMADIPGPRRLWTALITIVLADISMSLDNVLSVAALARNHAIVMILGIAASIAILMFVSKYVARLLIKFPWLNWGALAMIVWVAVDLISGNYDSVLTIMRS